MGQLTWGGDAATGGGASKEDVAFTSASTNSSNVVESKE